MSWIDNYFEWVKLVTQLYKKPPSMRDRTLYFMAEVIRMQSDVNREKRSDS